MITRLIVGDGDLPVLVRVERAHEQRAKVVGVLAPAARDVRSDGADRLAVARLRARRRRRAKVSSERGGDERGKDAWRMKV